MKVFNSLPLTAAIAGASALYNIYKSGNRASSSIAADRPFVTMRSRSSYRKSTRSSRSRRNYRPRVRRAITPSYNVLTRTTGTYNTFKFVSGATTAFKTDVIKLNYVQISDIVSAYDLYRIKYVDLVITPRIDPGNSGLASNTVAQVICACDPVSSSAPANILALGAYENHRSFFLTSGRFGVYRFYPKVANTVDNAGVTAPVGSYGVNPWLQCNTPGADIPHLSCQMGAMLQLAAPVAEIVLEYYFRICFEVKNIR